MTSRNARIVAQRDAGATFTELGRAYGLCRERIRQIIAGEKRRARLAQCPLSVRAWNVLRNMGLVQYGEMGEMTREALIARLQTVDLETIGAAQNCGVVTLREIAALLGCHDRFKQRGPGVVRVRETHGATR